VLAVKHLDVLHIKDLPHEYVAYTVC